MKNYSKIISVLLIFILLSGLIVNSQVPSWSKINSLLENKIISSCSDSKGNYYLTLYDVNSIVKANIFSGDIELLEKPIINGIQVEGIEVMSGVNEEFHPILKGRVYTYVDKKYIPVLLPDGSIGKANEPKAIYFNDKGEMFLFGISACYRYDTNWNRNSLVKIYDNNFTADLNAPSFYNSDTNFVLEYHQGNSNIKILNLNTERGDFKVIHTFDAPISNGKFSILERDGDFYIPTSQELYCYSNFGKDLFVPFIDPGVNGFISALAKGKVHKEFIINKGGKFYASYDGCKNWILLTNMNIDFPSDRINEFIVWDSLHAIAVITNNCGYEYMYYLDGINKKWNFMHFSKIDNPNLVDFRIDEMGNYLSVLNDCRVYVSYNKGLNWSPIQKINKINLLESTPDYLFYNVTEKEDFGIYKDSLYSTTDYGLHWKSLRKLPRNTRNIKYLYNGKFLLISDTLVNNQFFDKYYMLYNYGQSLEFKFVDYDGKFESKVFGIDHKNNLTSYSYVNYFKSTDDGLNWSIDDRFQGRAIRHMEYTNSGIYYLTTKINNVFALYSTSDFINFSNLTKTLGQFSNISFNLLNNENKIAIATFNDSEEFKIFYSDNGGRDWQNIHFDIDEIRGQDRMALVNSFYLDKEDNLLMSLAHDGLYKLSNSLIDTKNYNLSASIKLYPQPAITEIEISTTDIQKIRQYKILDFIGKDVRSQKFTSNKINVSDLNNGVYLLQIIGDKQVIGLSKFIKI